MAIREAESISFRQATRADRKQYCRRDLRSDPSSVLHPFRADGALNYGLFFDVFVRSGPGSFEDAGALR